MQSSPHSQVNGPSPIGVGLALVAMPRFFVAKRHVGERRPYTPLHRYGFALNVERLDRGPAASPNKNRRPAREARGGDVEFLIQVAGRMVVTWGEDCHR